jgi:hypothetical protein
MTNHPDWALTLYRSFSNADLLAQRYLSGIAARDGSWAGMAKVGLCNFILDERV